MYDPHPQICQPFSAIKQERWPIRSIRAIALDCIDDLEMCDRQFKAP